MTKNRLEDEKLVSVIGGLGTTVQTPNYVTVKSLQKTCISAMCKCDCLDTIQIDAGTYRQECTECGNLWYVEI